MHTFQQSGSIVTVDDVLQCALDNLEGTGMLQSKNRMDIEALLNPLEEFQVMVNTVTTVHR